MATQIFQGSAAAVAQVATVTITAYDASTTYILTVGSKAISVVGSGGTTTTVATALTAAWAASTFAEVLEVTATSLTNVVTLTALTAGVPFTVTSSVSGGTGTIGAVTAVTASAGPNDWSTAANWSTGTVPVSTDDIYLGGSVPIKYGLSQGAVVANTINSLDTWSADLGLPSFNGIAASGGYYEYRPTALVIQAVTINVRGSSGRIKLNTGTATATTINVFSTGQSPETGLQALLLQGSNAANVLNAYQGSIGLAVEAGQTCQYANVRVGYAQNQTSDVQLTAGTGATLATIDQDGGQVTLNGAVTTLTMSAGSTTLQGTGAITTLKGLAGTFLYKSTGTLTTVTAGSKWTLDTSGDVRPKTITNMSVMPGATVRDHDKSITFTNAFTLTNCGLEDATLELGKGLAVQRT